MENTTTTATADLTENDLSFYQELKRSNEIMQDCRENPDDFYAWKSEQDAEWVFKLCLEGLGI